MKLILMAENAVHLFIYCLEMGYRTTSHGILRRIKY